MQSYHDNQHFALDKDGNIINIQNVEGFKKQKYYCPYCQGEMIPKCGNIRQWHFAHKSDKCSYDKYLHSIAEKLIMQWFNESNSIELYMDVDGKCEQYNSGCLFYNEAKCIGKRRIPFNLKEYYSKCIQEYKYQDFIADLYCERKNQSNSPIFIEILVTHECSQEKKDSGIRIIELIIQSEEDILNIINSTKLEEGEKIRLYNFRPQEISIKTLVRPFQKYILYPTLKSYIKKDGVTCKNYNQFRFGVYEITMPADEFIPYFMGSGGLYMAGKVKAYLDGFLKKDCQLCKWQGETMDGERFCKLYKKCGNPKYCKDNDVPNCPMFRADSSVIEKVYIDFKEYLVFGKIDIWQLDSSKDIKQAELNINA